jgi:PAS domain S-box-containing protein
LAALETENAALAESEARYRAVLDSAQDFVFTVSADGRVLYVNRFAAATLSATPEEIVGRRVAELFSEDTSQRQAANLRRVLETGESLHLQNETEFPDGPRWLDTWLLPARSDSGAVVAVTGVSRDITARVEYEQRLRTTIENAPIALWTVDRERRFAFAGGETLRSLGLRPEDVVGRDASELFPALAWFSELRPRLARSSSRG